MALPRLFPKPASPPPSEAPASPTEGAVETTVPVSLENLNLENFDLADVTQILSAKIASWLVAATASLPNLIAAALLVVAFILLARLSRRLLRQLLGRFSKNQSLIELFATIVHVAIIFVGLFIALGVLNLDKTVTSLLTGAGIITLALGFAFQDIASNFFAGILIAFRKPYQLGDIVQVDTHVGVVKRIELRMTMLRTFDGLDILIPNKNMLTQVVTNATLTPDRRVSLNVGVAYGSDLALVERAARQALEALPCRIADRPVEFYFKAFGESAILFEAQFWITYRRNKDLNEAQHLAVLAMDKAFRTEGILIPFPMRTLHLSRESRAALGVRVEPNGEKNV